MAQTEKKSKNKQKQKPHTYTKKPHSCSINLKHQVIYGLSTENKHLINISTGEFGEMPWFFYSNIIKTTPNLKQPRLRANKENSAFANGGIVCYLTNDLTF